MARPANANPERTKDKLLDAASGLFASKGVEGTSIREVAKSAGLTMASIHYYFGNKDGLHAACVERAYQQLASEVAPLAALLKSLSAALADAAVSDANMLSVVERLVREGFAFARRHQPQVRLMMRPLIEHGELDPAWRDQAFVPFLGEAAAVLAEATGREVTVVRLEVQSLVALVVRYSLSSPRELVRLTGMSGPRGAWKAQQGAAIRALEDHLVRLAHRSLLEVS